MNLMTLRTRVARSGSTRHGSRITLLGLIFFFCSLLCLTALLVWSDATRKVDRLLHDSWVRYDQRTVPSDVVIAAIDTHSLNEFGRWPWSRELQAQLFEQLAEYGVTIAVIDLLYTEASERRMDDVRLGASLAAIPSSVLPVLTERGVGRSSLESLPVPDILRHVDTLGHVFLPIDDDGIVRRVFLKAGINQAHWPSLSLAALDLLGQEPDPLPGSQRPVSGSFGNWELNNEVLIPFYGSNGSFPRISAADIIRGIVPPEALRGKIVFVGMTTSGLGDVVPTPVSALDQPVPGVEIHANIFGALRDGVMVTKLNPYFSLLVAFILLPQMLLVYSRATPEWGAVGAAVGSLVPVIVSYLLYRYANVWLAPLAASLPVLVSYLFWSRHRLQYVNRFLEEEQQLSSKHLPKRVISDNAALENFFNSASRHLPIDAWRFSIGQEQFSGGDTLPMTLPAGVDDGWAKNRDVYVRRYPAVQGLLVEMRVTDEAMGEQITEYVDSLARVRGREQATVFTGSIERLQTNVLNVSEQLEWLRSIKVFSDTMLAAAPAGFAVWNPAGESIRTNRLVSKLVKGFHYEGDLLEFVTCLGHSPDQGKNAEHFNNLILNKKPWQIVFRKSEQELIVSIRAVGDRLARRLICATVVDVTEIRTAEKARAEMVDYLSHDLRSPLISALYLLEPGADPNIENNIQQSLTMMDDLLHIARADSLSESRFEPLLLNAVLDNTLDQLLPQARNRCIRFSVNTEDDDLWIVGDAASLERAFTNIVGNAIKYSAPDTIVTISLGSDGQLARLTVDDEGVGINPEMLDHLFTRFKRDGTTARSHKGIGLGLALVARVVNMHNGQVRASNLTVGTRITVELPLENKNAETDQDALNDDSTELALAELSGPTLS